MPKPSPTTYPVYFKKYVDQVPEEDLLTGFQNQLTVIKEFLITITEEKSIYAYDTFSQQRLSLGLCIGRGRCVNF